MVMMGTIDDLLHIGEGDSLPDALEDLLEEVLAADVDDEIEDLSHSLEAMETTALKMALSPEGRASAKSPGPAKA